MSETSSSPRRALYLVPSGLPAGKQEELRKFAQPGAEIFVLTEANAREALEKIFAADTVAVWGKV